MTYLWEWDGDSDGAVIYWQDEANEIGKTNSKQGTKDGIPVGSREVVAEWINEQSVPDEQQLQEAIERLTALVAGDFEFIGVQEA